MSKLRPAAFLGVLLSLSVFAAAQSCPVDTSTALNARICAPVENERVPGRFSLAFSAFSASAPITGITVNSGGQFFRFTPNSNQFAKDMTLELVPRYDNYYVLVQVWNANGEYTETFVTIWVRKTAGTCKFSSVSRTLNVCEPGLTGTVQGPVKVVANAYSTFFISHIKVYVDGVERYFADDDEVYTYIDLTPGAHTITVQAWDSQGFLLRETRSLTVEDRAAACPPLSGDGVRLCQPPAGQNTVAPLRVSARTGSSGVPITYMRLYREGNPIWEGPFSSVFTDVHYQLLGLPEGTANFGMVAWNANGMAFVDARSATVKGYMPAPACAVAAHQTVVLCYPAQGDVVPRNAIVSARARWDGKKITAMRVYIDDQANATFFLTPREDSIYRQIELAPGQHRIVIVAWTNTGEALVSPAHWVTVY